jgi:hypothetical protein
VPAIGQSSVGGTDGTDDRVTGQRYVRHDGGSRRQANEPFSVVDPTDPETVVAGWNDYCLTDLGAGWQGFAFSRITGETWTNSLVPGYPQDTSTEGRASPLYADHTDAGDPIAAFDNDGNLFVGGISFNREGPVNGDVYVTNRTFPVGSRRSAALAFNRSMDGGASFGKAQLIRNITEYFPSDGERDSGDGPYVCPTEYVFHRVPLEPRVTSDQSGELPGVYLTYNAIRPGSTTQSNTSFDSAGPGTVGQSLVYVIRTTNNGASWSQPKAVDAAPRGHQFFSDIDAFRGDGDYSAKVVAGHQRGGLLLLALR